MEYRWTKIPIYEEWDYEYSVALEGVNYVLRFYYKDRTQTWTMSISYEEGDPIVLGEMLSPKRVIMLDRIKGLNGFFWMEPISNSINETVINPDKIYKYYNLYYILPGAV